MREQASYSQIARTCSHCQPGCQLSGSLVAGGPICWKRPPHGPLMSTERWGLLIGLATVVVVRIIDWYLPKGYHSRWAERHGIKSAEEEENDDVD